MVCRACDFKELEYLFVDYLLRYKKHHKLFIAFNEEENLVFPFRVIVNPYIRRNQVLWAYLGSGLEGIRENAKLLVEEIRKGIGSKVGMKLPKTDNIIFKTKDSWTPIAIAIKNDVNNWKMSLFHEIGHLFISQQTKLACCNQHNIFKAELMSWGIAKALCEDVVKDYAQVVRFWENEYVAGALKEWEKCLGIRVDFSESVIRRLEIEASSSYEKFSKASWNIFSVD